MEEENKQENVEENATENEIVNGFVNGSLNDGETDTNHAGTVENTEKIENGNLDNAVESTVDHELSIPLEQEENTVELHEENTEDLEEEIEGEWNEDDPENWEEEEEDGYEFPDEEEEDILGSYAQEEKGEKPIEEVLDDATGDSVKSKEALKDLGELIIDFMDDSKANLCSAISGQDASKYASGQKLNKALLKAFIAYMDSQEVKAPTPFGTLMITLALWGLPSLAASYFHRRQAKKAEKQAVERQNTTETKEGPEVTGESKTDSLATGTLKVDFTQTKEYQDKRRLFDLHASTGCYSRDLSGKFAKISLSSEKPSPAVQALIDQGYDNAKIRSTLYPE